MNSRYGRTIHLPNTVHKRQPLHSGMCLANVEAGAALSPPPIDIRSFEERHFWWHMTSSKLKFQTPSQLANLAIDHAIQCSCCYASVYNTFTMSPVLVSLKVVSLNSLRLGSCHETENKIAPVQILIRTCIAVAYNMNSELSGSPSNQSY